MGSTFRCVRLLAAALVLFIHARVAGASSALDIQWLSPGPGDTFRPGQSIAGRWTSATPVNTPSFRLCAVNAADADADDTDDASIGTSSTLVPTSATPSVASVSDVSAIVSTTVTATTSTGAPAGTSVTTPATASVGVSGNWSSDRAGDDGASSSQPIGDTDDDLSQSRVFRRGQVASSNGNCGEAIWADVVQSDGVYSVNLTVPSANINSAFYLQMEDNFGQTVASPSFQLSNHTATHPSAHRSAASASAAPSATADLKDARLVSTQHGGIPIVAIVVPLVVIGILALLALCVALRRRETRPASVLPVPVTAPIPPPPQPTLPSPDPAHMNAYRRMALHMQNWRPDFLQRGERQIQDLEKAIVIADAMEVLAARDGYTSAPRRQRSKRSHRQSSRRSYGSQDESGSETDDSSSSSRSRSRSPEHALARQALPRLNIASPRLSGAPREYFHGHGHSIDPSALPLPSSPNTPTSFRTATSNSGNGIPSPTSARSIHPPALTPSSRFLAPPDLVLTRLSSSASMTSLSMLEKPLPTPPRDDLYERVRMAVTPRP